MTDQPTDTDMWNCPNCGTIPPEAVTFEETCDHCGCNTSEPTVDTHGAMPKPDRVERFLSMFEPSPQPTYACWKAEENESGHARGTTSIERYAEAQFVTGQNHALREVASWFGDNTMPTYANIKKLIEAQRVRAEKEKASRVYYQSIVYDLCNAIDKLNGGSVVCGTNISPSTDLQEAFTSTIAENARLREALAFYASLDNYKIEDIEVGECLETGSPRFVRSTHVYQDQGRQGRQALTQPENKGDEDA